MRIGFVDNSDWDYHVDSVGERPLGGSQSAACYLARALARRGFDVHFLTNVAGPPARRSGVLCRNWRSMAMDEARALDLDVAVCLHNAALGGPLREIFAPRACLLWSQHAHDQDAVQPLGDAAARAAFDAVAAVSEWQRGEFVRRFGLDPAHVVVRRNAIAPAFENLLGDAAILPQKRDPPVLAYTSTPFRGLDRLLDAWPAIRAAIPDARLEVYSSMRVYQASAAADEADYGRLYDACRRTDGIDYVGSIPQPALAQRLRAATMLAYPNTFAETSCIAVMEAMASGCLVVTSDLAALPETTAGFARLIAPDGDRGRYVQHFAAQVIDALRERHAQPARTEALLRRQVDYVNRELTWDARAAEWADWLASLPDGSRAATAPGFLARALGRLRGSSRGS